MDVTARSIWACVLPYRDEALRLPSYWQLRLLIVSLYQCSNGVLSSKTRISGRNSGQESNPLLDSMTVLEDWIHPTLKAPYSASGLYRTAPGKIQNSLIGGLAFRSVVEDQSGFNHTEVGTSSNCIPAP